MVLEKINRCYLAHNPEHDIHIREYYRYCTSLLRKRLEKQSEDINIIFGPYNVVFPNQNRVVRIDLQVEHTLVKEGGRSVDQVLYGTVQYGEGNYYLIRIPNYEYYSSLDYVIEYSAPNIHNVSTNSLFNEYRKKLLHIYPTLYKPEISTVEGREGIYCLFTKGNIRRDTIVDKMQKNKLSINNITDCFESEELQSVYRRGRVLVNIHQTDHHDTFEELRVLPALLNGIVVVSEDVPLKDKILYSDLIIWTSYEDLPNKVLEVNNNYEYYHNMIFGKNKLEEYSSCMIKNNSKNISLIA